MKLKNIPISIKILVLSLFAVLVTVGIIQGTSVLAEPTLEDLVTERNCGLLDISGHEVDWETADCNSWLIVEQLETTNIFVPLEKWTDVNEDGHINLDDVYTGDDVDICQNLWFYRNYSTLYDYGDNDFYILINPLYLDTSEAVCANLFVGKNTNDADTYGFNNFVYDEQNKCAYVRKNCIEQSDVGSRSELVYIVKDISSISKDLPIVFLINTDEEKQEQAESIFNDHNTVINLVDSSLNGIEIQIVDEANAGYITKDDIGIYLNGISEEKNFTYNDSTGILSIQNQNICDVMFLMIEIKDIHDENNDLLMKICFRDIASAAVDPQWENISNCVDFYLQYENGKEPQLGTMADMDFIGGLGIRRMYNASSSYYTWSNNANNVTTSSGTPNILISCPKCKATWSSWAFEKTTSGKYYFDKYESHWCPNCGEGNFVRSNIEFHCFMNPYYTTDEQTYKDVLEYFACKNTAVAHGESIVTQVHNFGGQERDVATQFTLTSASPAIGLYRDWDDEKIWGDIFTNAYALVNRSEKANTSVAMMKAYSNMLSGVSTYDIETNISSAYNFSMYGVPSRLTYGSYGEYNMNVLFAVVSGLNVERRSQENFTLFDAKIVPFDSNKNAHVYFTGTCVHATRSLTIRKTAWVCSCSNSKGLKQYTSTCVYCGNAAPSSSSADTYNLGAAQAQYETKVVLSNIIEPTTADGYGTLCFAIVPKTLSSVGGDSDPQQMLTFAAVKYKSGRVGTISIEKTSDNKSTAILGGERKVGGAVYEIYDNSDSANWRKSNRSATLSATSNATHFNHRIDILTTSSSGTATSCAIPYGETTYYIVEVSAPTGWVLNDDITEFKMDSSNDGKTFQLYDTKQYQHVDITVIDLTTDGTSDKPVAGVKFRVLKDGANFETVTSDDNGKISLNLLGSAAGVAYKIEQIETVTDYCMDDNAKNDTGKKATSSTGWCEFTVKETNAGTQLSIITKKHLEPRQYVTIESHVRDADSANPAGTKAVTLESPGNTTGNEDVKTLEAKYRLKTKSKIFLGYDSAGNKVTINAGQNLTLCEELTGTANHNYTTTSGIAVAKNLHYDKAYVYAEYISYNGQKWRLPNGTYEWVLVGASPGYYINENADTTTVDNTVWSSDTTRIQSEFFNSTNKPVYEYRQQASISVGVKRVYENNFNPRKGFSEIVAGVPLYQMGIVSNEIFDAMKKDEINKYFDEHSDITSTINTAPTNQDPKDYPSNNVVVYWASKGTKIAEDTEDKYVVAEDGKKIYYVTNTGFIKNNIFVIRTASDIALFDGTIISKGTIIGYYKSSNINATYIDELGSNAIINPNLSSCDFVSKFNAISFGSNVKLPLGDYTAELLLPSDGDDTIKYFRAFDITVKWDGPSSNSSIVDRDPIDLLVFHDPIPSDKIAIAPDPIWTEYQVYPDPQPDYRHNPYVEFDPEDPYDPKNPDDVYDPEDPQHIPNLDDSDDIPTANKDWILKHKNNYAYRIIDSDNIEQVPIDEHTYYEKYEVQDELPTPFAFAIYEDVPSDSDSLYKIYFYYEIPQSEYPANGDDDPEYYSDRINGVTHYYRRFATPTNKTGAKDLMSTIVLNQRSKGYISYSEAYPNASVGGAIIDTEWLNEQFTTYGFDEYRIAIGLEIQRTYTTNWGYTYTDKEFQGFNSFIIKPRQLFPLN